MSQPQLLDPFPFASAPRGQRGVCVRVARPAAPASSKRLRRARRVALSAIALCLFALGARAFAAEHTSATTLTVENDVLNGSDDAYTNGIGATWVSDDLATYDEQSSLRRWGNFWSFLPFVGDAGYKTYASWSLGQEMHTPSDITIKDPPLTEQPYAGILYVDNVIYARSDTWSHAWELKLGVSGNASGAASTQRHFHKLIGADEPMGWQTQIPEEPIVNLGYTAAHLWKAGTVGESAQWRLVPVGSVSLGNYYTGASAGMYGEVGWNLVNALGGTSLREGLNAASSVGVGPVNGWSVSFFGGVGGHAVAHYMPLDGTLFRDSRSVDTRPFIGNATVGASLRHGRLAVSLSDNFSTKAFDGQDTGTGFANLSVSWFQ